MAGKSKARPTKRALKRDLQYGNRGQVAAKYGVTYKTLWTWCQRYGIPPKAAGNSNLTHDDVRSIRACRAQGVSAYILAREWGLGLSTVYSIAARRSWKNVD
jgi:transposase